MADCFADMDVNLLYPGTIKVDMDSIQKRNGMIKSESDAMEVEFHVELRPGSGPGSPKVILEIDFNDPPNGTHLLDLTIDFERLVNHNISQATVIGNDGRKYMFPIGRQTMERRDARKHWNQMVDLFRQSDADD